MKTLYFLILVILTIPLFAQDKKEVKQKTKIETLQEEIQKRPESAELHLQLGMEYLNSDDSENAAKELELSKKFFEKAAPFLLYLKLGEAYYNNDKYEEAKLEFLKAQEKIPGEWNSKGYLNICNAKLTIAGLGKVSAEEMAEAEYKLVQAYSEMGLYSFAKSDLETLMENFPDNQKYKKMSEKIIKAETANDLLGEGNDYYAKSDYKQALEFYEKSLAISKDLGDRKDEANAIGNIGLVYQSKGDYKQALEFYEKSLAISKNLGDRQGEAYAINDKGNVYSYKGDYKQALEFYEKSLAISKDFGDRQGEANALMGKGNVYESKGNYKKALDFYKKSLAINEEFEGGRKGEANNLNNIGIVYFRKGDYKQALEFYEKSLAIFKDLKDGRGEASAIMNIGIVYSSKGDYKQALEFYEKSLAMKKDLGDRQGEADAIINIGSLYYSKGDYEKYFQFTGDALKAVREIEDKYGEMVCYENFGEYWQAIGQNKEAIEEFKTALKLAKNLEAKDRIAEIYGLLSNSYVANKDYTEAIKYLDKSISLYKEIETKPNLVTAYISYSRTFLEHKKTGAKPYIQKAEEIEKAIGRKPQLAEIHLLYAKDFLLSKQYSEAEKEARSVLEIADKLGIPATTWEAYKVMGDIQLAAGKKKESIQSYERSISILRSMYSLLGEKKKTGFMQDKLEVYESLIQLLIEEKKYTEAREYLEEFRHFILRANRDFTKVEIQDENTKTIYEEIIKKKIELNNLENQIQEARNAGTVDALKISLKKVRHEYLNKLEELRQSSEEGRNLFNELSLNYEKNIDFNEVLPEDTVLVEYVLLDNVTYIFCFTKEKPLFFTSRLVGRKEIGDLVKEFSRKIEKEKDYKNWNSKESEKLYTHLIEPIKNQLKKHIIFMPFGILYSLPFEALTMPDRRYLVEEHYVSYFSNISAMRILQLEKKKLSNKEKVVIAFAPPVELYHSEAEVNGIGKIFPNESKILIKEKASIDNFEKEAKDFFIVHLSTHGNLCNPVENSNLVFSTDHKKNLTLNKIRGLNNSKGLEKTQLVVMSACETSIGSKAIGPAENQADYAVIPCIPCCIAVA